MCHLIISFLSARRCLFCAKCSTVISEGKGVGGKDWQNPQTNAIIIFQCRHCQLLLGKTVSELVHPCSLLIIYVN